MLEPQGFTGIAISLLGLTTPIGTFLVGIFYGVLQYGGYLIQGDLLGGFKPEIVDVIISTIIYISALSLFVKMYLKKIIKYISDLSKPKEELEKGGDE